MKFKQLYPKSVRPLSTNNLSNNVNKQRTRCSLCDSLLKSSTSHRYFLLGKSIHENLDQGITYGECCQRYLNENYQLEKFHMICPKCCQNLQEVYSLHKNAEELKEKLRQTWYKTKRLNRTRHSRVNFVRFTDNISSPSFPTMATDDNIQITIKEEIDSEQIPLDLKQSKIPISETVLANIPCDLSNNQRIHNNNNSYALKMSHQSLDNNNHEITNGSKIKNHVQKQVQSLPKKPNTNSRTTRKSHPTGPYQTFLPTQTSRSVNTNEQEYYSKFLYQSAINNQSTGPFAQLMIDSPSPSSSSSNQQQQTEVRRRSSSASDQPTSAINYEPSIDGDRSLSPRTNDDETSSMNGSKGTRLSRRQYDFLIKLADQQSLNTFIETSSAESGSRWTWRRTSANSRGYKVYYVCNFSMRRHYHPCPAAMYALFHPEGSISIYSCGQHQHIPKDRLPVSITDATKDEIFKCLQAGMATTEIREHLTRLQLPFGDTRKLNNFIKYHKELLRFGTVTNVRIGGTAYRQPQCWAIRRQPSTPAPPPPPPPATATINNDDTIKTS